MLDLLPLPAAPSSGEPTTQPAPASLRVIKFGGSSLASTDRIRRVAAIVGEASRAEPLIVVVSAFEGVTDALLECARQAEAGADETGYDAIVARHRAAVRALVPAHDRVTRTRIARDLRELRDALRGIRLLGCCPPAALDAVASVGERLSAAIVAGHLRRLRPARVVDAREFVATDEQFTHAAVNLAATNHAAREYFGALWTESPSLVAVVTGFVGRSAAGRTTTIGRNGSDYTAAIVGAALGAAIIEIWTDVDGILTADPKTARAPSAIPQITYDTALEMSHAGAKVLHPATIGPAIAKSIPIAVKNTFNPSAPGTLISASLPDGPALATGSVTGLGGLTLLTLRSSGRSAGRSHAARLARALASHEIDIVFAVQACSELSISVAVHDAQAVAAIEAVQQEFCFECERGLARLVETPGQALVTAIGAGGREELTIAAPVFDALGRHDIALSGFSHGISPRSVSCLVGAADQSRAIRIIHHEVFERDRSLAVALFGVGQVGGALLDELRARQSAWRAQGIDLKVMAIANRRRCVFAPDGVPLADWRGALDASGQSVDPRAVAAAIRAAAPPHAAVVDCTAGMDVVDAFDAFVAAGCHIVTPNKRAGVVPWERYTRLRETLAARGRRLLDAATVGAGLPILAAIRDLVSGGDVICKIEGILSGTLGCLFSSFGEDVPFSACVRTAYQAGLTEPDPRDDLRGDDVGRKLLILARAIGLPLEQDDIAVESLLAPHLCGGPLTDDWFAAFAAHDDAFRARLCRARAHDSVLRYVAMLDGGRASASLREIPRDHPLAQVKGSDNVVAITSGRYSSEPLVIRGPGAGALQTAKALVADLTTLIPGARKRLA